MDPQTDPGYGYSSGGSSGSDLAGSIASIFQSGVTAYVDSQAIQRGYQINNPAYYQAGYPAGVPTPYQPIVQGAPAGVAVGASSMGSLLLVGGLVALVLLIVRK